MTDAESAPCDHPLQVATRPREGTAALGAWARRRRTEGRDANWRDLKSPTYLSGGDAGDRSALPGEAASTRSQLGWAAWQGMEGDRGGTAAAQRERRGTGAASWSGRALQVSRQLQHRVEQRTHRCSQQAGQEQPARRPEGRRAEGPKQEPGALPLQEQLGQEEGRSQLKLLMRQKYLWRWQHQ